jgi:hypothetical protein
MQSFKERTFFLIDEYDLKGFVISLRQLMSDVGADAETDTDVDAEIETETDVDADGDAAAATAAEADAWSSIRVASESITESVSSTSCSTILMLSAEACS